MQFADQENERIQGDTIVSNLRTAVERFTPLTFVGAQIPISETGFLPINESFASEIVLTAPDDRQFVDFIDSLWILSIHRLLTLQLFPLALTD